MVQIGTQFFYSQISKQMRETNSKINDTQTQISTGKNSQTYSGYGSNAKTIIDLQHQKSKMREYIANNDYMIGCQDHIESTIKGLITLGSVFRSNLASLNSGTLPDPLTFTSLVRANLESVQAILNRTDMDGGYIFAGSLNLPPVDLSKMPTLGLNAAETFEYYQGNDDIRSVQSDSDLVISYGVNANEPAIEKLIRSMSMATNEIIVGQSPELLDQTMNIAAQSLAELTEILARVGNVQKNMINANERIKDDKVLLDQTLNLLEDVDLPEALTNLTHQQTQLTALFMALTAKKTSLIDFMR